MTIRDIRQKIELTSALESLSIAYSDLAGQRLVKIRKDIELNRGFVSELSSLFHVIKNAAIKQGSSVSLGKKGNINLLITSNQRFYGGLEKRLLDFFIAYSVLTYAKTIVVGATGERYLENSDFAGSYLTLKFKKDIPTQTELGQILDMVQPFEKVNVYYTKMQSLLVQKPAVLEVGGIADVAIDTAGTEQYFIFEPELGDMLKFFDRKIVQVLIAQAFFESELARTAARMVSMEQSKINAGKMLTQLNNQLYIEKGNMLTFRMLDMISCFGGKKYEE